MHKFFKNQGGMVNIGGIILIAIAMLIAAVGTYFMAPLIDAFDDARNSESTETITDRALKKTSDNTTLVTLTNAMIDTDTSNINSLSSDGPSDVPVTNSCPSTRTVNVSGLQDSAATRNISVSYDYSSTPQFTATDTTIKVGPTLIILGFIISVGIVGFMGIKLVSKG